MARATRWNGVTDGAQRIAQDRCGLGRSCVAKLLLALPATASARSYWSIDKAQRVVARKYHGENFVICVGRGASRTRRDGAHLFRRFGCIIDRDADNQVVQLSVLGKHRYSVFEIT